MTSPQRLYSALMKASTSASGMVPYFHFVGAETGRGEDLRWQKTGADYFQWTARHDTHLATRRSIANSDHDVTTTSG